MIPDKDIRDIIAYLDRSLPLHRRYEFEARLESEPELKEKYKIHYELQLLLEDVELEELVKSHAVPDEKKPAGSITASDPEPSGDKLKPLYPEPPKAGNADPVQWKIAPWQKIAASVVLLLAMGLGVYLFRPGPVEGVANVDPLPPGQEIVTDSSGEKGTETPAPQDPGPEQLKPAQSGPLLTENENTLPSQELPGVPEYRNLKIAFRQTSGTKGLSALPDGSGNQPAFVVDSIPWSLNISRLPEGDERGKGNRLGTHELNRNNRTLQLMLNDSGNKIIEAAAPEQIVLERQSDMRSTLLIADRPVFLLLGDGSVEFVD